jgi:exopolysaccharide biosynthesis polyprenyl glycosylphosphotransferase
MLRQHARLVDLGLRLGDLLVLLAALPVAHMLHAWQKAAPDPTFSLGPYSAYATTALLAWIAWSWMFDVYAPYRTEALRNELARLGCAMALVALTSVPLSYLWQGYGVHFRFAAPHAAVALALLAAGRAALRVAARFVRRRGYNTRRFAVVGSGDLAEEVVEEIALHPEWGYELAGYILEDATPAPGDVPVLGRLRELGTVLENEVLDEVLFAVRGYQLERIAPAVQLCEEQGVAVRICLGSFADGRARLAVSDLGRQPTLSLTRTPSDEIALAVKRAFDVLLSASILLLLAPVLAAVAVGIRLDSAGPVFFRQRRVGLNGREFTLFKFRSMRLGAEAELAGLRALNEMDGPVFKIRRDPRITRIGGFLRRTSIDELPQFLNVLRGEMSVVGPRPPIPSEVRQYKRWQRRRLSVKPGITCTWQISGRNDIDFEHWMELDLQYIDGWSLWRDIRICLRTIPAVLLTRGAR